MIHLAFKHEAMRTGDFTGAIDSDMAAHQAIGEALTRQSDKPFVSTGGTLMLAMAGITGRPGTEDDQSEGGPGSTRRTTRSRSVSKACAPPSSGWRRWCTAISTTTASRTR